MDPFTQHLGRLVENALKPFAGCALAALTVTEDQLTLEVLGFLPLQALLALSQALDCDQIEMRPCA